MVSAFTLESDYTSVKSGSATSTHLDCIRGLAALLVYCSHIRLFFCSEFSTLAATGILVDSFYLVTKLGHAAVMVFFVLSGYLVGGSVVKSMFAERWSWGSYLLKRATRLYIVLVPALVLTALWDTPRVRSFSRLTVHAAHGTTGATLVSSHWGAPAFVCNLLFFQTVLSPPYGSNAPLWSLAWEWWYYILFPCCLLAAKSDRRTLYALVIVLMVAVLGWHIALYFAIWLMGATIGLWPIEWRKRLSTPVLLCGMIVVLIMAALVEAQIAAHGASVGMDFSVGGVTTLLIASLVDNTDLSAQGLYPRVAHRLASLSYTLYVVHVPFLLFLRAAFVIEPLSPSVMSLPALVAISGSGLIYASVVWWAAESRTDQIREAIGHAVGLARTQETVRT